MLSLCWAVKLVYLARPSVEAQPQLFIHEFLGVFSPFSLKQVLNAALWDWGMVCLRWCSITMLTLRLPDYSMGAVEFSVLLTERNPFFILTNPHDNCDCSGPYSGLPHGCVKWKLLSHHGVREKQQSQANLPHKVHLPPVTQQDNTSFLWAGSSSSNFMMITTGTLPHGFNIFKVYPFNLWLKELYLSNINYFY